MLNYRQYGKKKPPFGTRMKSLAKGLEGRWMMNEGQGGWLYDVSGRNNTCTLVSLWDAGQFGPCTYYNDPARGATINPLPANLKITSNISITLWIRPESGWTDGAGGSQYNYIFDTANDTDGFTFQTGDSGLYVSYIAHDWFTTVSFTVGVWTHMALVHDGATVHLYKDGNEINSTAAAGTTTYDAASKLCWGVANSNGNYWRGSIDDARIYNRPLTPTEVRQLVMYPFEDFAYPNWAMEAAFVALTTNPARMTLPTYPVKRASNW